MLARRAPATAMKQMMIPLRTTSRRSKITKGLGSLAYLPNVTSHKFDPPSWGHFAGAVAEDGCQGYRGRFGPPQRSLRRINTQGDNNGEGKMVGI
jgi:hypothetical protein